MIFWLSFLGVLAFLGMYFGDKYYDLFKDYNSNEKLKTEAAKAKSEAVKTQNYNINRINAESKEEYEKVMEHYFVPWARKKGILK